MCQSIREEDAVLGETINDELFNAKQVARSALGQLGELGQVLLFFEQISQCENYNEIASAIFETLDIFDANITIQIRDELNDYCYVANGEVPDLDEKILTHLHLHPDRIISFERRCVINFEHISILVKNMPDDKEREILIKDHIVRMLHATEQRIKFIVNKRAIDNQHDIAVEKTVSVANKLLSEVNDKFQNHRLEINNILATLVAKLDDGLLRLGLDEDQELYFKTLIDETSDTIFHYHENGLEVGESYEQLLSQIRDVL